MVAALVMAAAIRPRPVFVKMAAHSGAATRRSQMTGYQIVGFHGAGTTR